MSPCLVKWATFEITDIPPKLSLSGLCNNFVHYDAPIIFILSHFSEISFNLSLTVASVW